MNDAPTPRQLVESASGGDATAVNALLDRYLPGLRQFLRRRAGGLLARESSADLAQSVCRELLEHLQDGRFQYQGEQPFKQWLYQAALHKLQDRRRYHGADMRDAARECAAGSAEVFHSLSTPSQGAVLQEQLAAFDCAFQELSEEQREIIALARVEGLSHRQIAGRLGLREGASRVALSRALARLATLCRRHGAGDVLAPPETSDPEPGRGS